MHSLVFERLPGATKRSDKACLHVNQTNKLTLLVLNGKNPHRQTN